LLLLACCWHLAARADGAAIQFVDVAARAGIVARNICGPVLPKRYIMEVDGAGVAFLDYDNDGDLDILLVQGSTLSNYAGGGDLLCVLYRNDGGGKFTDVTRSSGMTRRGWGFGVCIGDYDNDGWDDVYITCLGPDVLYKNMGNGTFRDVSKAAGIDDNRFGTGAAFVDYDRDGFLDLYVANYVTLDVNHLPEPASNTFCFYRGLVPSSCGPRAYEGAPHILYHNNRDGTFTDVSARLQVDRKYHGFGVVCGDYDNDGDPDIYVANDTDPNYLWRNNGDGTFTDVGVPSGSGLSEHGRAQAGMGTDLGDFDNDGLLDIVVTNFSTESYTLYHGDGRGLFTDVTRRAGLAEATSAYLGWGTQFFDFDNDGWKDIFFSNGHVHPEVDAINSGTSYAQRNQVFQNLHDGKFAEVMPTAGSGLAIVKSSRGAAFGDFDNDGDIDVLVANINDAPTLLENRGGERLNRWITLKLIGTKSNRSAIGARVTITAAGLKQMAEVKSGGSYLSQSDLRIHFGLGKAKRADEVVVRWPSGLTESFKNLETNRFYLVTEGRGNKKL